MKNVFLEDFYLCITIKFKYAPEFMEDYFEFIENINFIKYLEKEQERFL